MKGVSSGTQIRSIVIAILGLAIVGFLVGWAQGSFTSTPLPTGNGHLEIAGEIYEFATDTCSITEDSFVASGPGMTDGQQFWISASNDSIDIAVGAESITQAPADEDLWLTSFNDIDWYSEDSQLSGSASMSDSRVDNPLEYSAALSVSCTPTA